jgi:hypothetical protein
MANNFVRFSLYSSGHPAPDSPHTRHLHTCVYQIVGSSPHIHTCNAQCAQAALHKGHRVRLKTITIVGSNPAGIYALQCYSSHFTA